MIGYGRGGGGGGFGGFPYRSSHQQGQDGRGGGRGRGRGGRGGGRGRRVQQQQRQRAGGDDVSYQAELQIPPAQRGLLVGRGGATLKQMREDTGARIFVPREQQRRRQRGQQHQQRYAQDGGDVGQAPAQEQPSSNDDSSNNNNGDPHRDVNVHPVRANASDLPDLLHAFYEIRTVLSRDNPPSDDGSSVPCSVKIRSNNSRGSNNRDHVEVKVEGHLLFPSLTQQSDDAANSTNEVLFRGTVIAPQNSNNGAGNATNDTSSAAAPSGPTSSKAQQLLAFGIETELSEDDVFTAVDNVRFVDLSVDACRWFYRHVPGNSNNDENGVETNITRRGGLLFIFGTANHNPHLICHAVEVAAASGR